MLAWYGLWIGALSIAISYHPSSSELGIPGDESMLVGCVGLFMLPFVGLASGYYGSVALSQLLRTQHPIDGAGSCVVTLTRKT